MPKPEFVNIKPLNIKKTSCFFTLIVLVAAFGKAGAQKVTARPLTVLETNRKMIDSLDNKIIETIALRETR